MFYFCEAQMLCKYVGSRINILDGQTELLHQTSTSSVSNLNLETILPQQTNQFSL